MTSADEIADALVVHLNGLVTSITFEATNPPMGPVINREATDATLQVQPWEEIEESQTHSDDMLGCERVVNVIVQAPLEKSRTLKGCLKWLNEVKEGFRGLTLTTADGGTWRWNKNETVSLYDSDALTDKRQFISLFRATFYAFA